MKLAELAALMCEFDATGLTALKWEREGECIVLEKALQAAEPTQPAQAVQAVQSTAPAAEIVQQPTVPVQGERTDAIGVKAPLVGVFYAASTPDAVPFVQEGQRVKKGQVLCLIEAMKMMNELTSPVDGILTRVCAANEEVVSFDQLLFEVVPC